MKQVPTQTKPKEHSTDMDKLRELLVRQALDVWAPSFPRRASRSQQWVDGVNDAALCLLDAEQDAGNFPFISVYSFPRGHSKHDNIPKVDTLFIDFDIEDGDYVSGSGDRAAWRRDLSKLLVRVRRVAKHLDKSGATGWRAALSGHKGVHLFLDFPELPPSAGEFREFTTGMTEYADDLVDQLQEETRIDDLNRWVDVTSADLGRLCRVPNTLHGGATESFNEQRFCVPISIEELAQISVDKYIDYTSVPHPVSFEREPNQDVHDVLVQYVRTASPGEGQGNTSSSVIDFSRVEQYNDAANDKVELADVRMMTSDRPCVWRFHERADKYQYGYQSHYAEMWCIQELIEKMVPVDVIVDFLDSAPEFDEEYSRRRIREIIAHDYNRFSLSAVQENAPEFVGYDDCGICNRVLQ